MKQLMLASLAVLVTSLTVRGTEPATKSNTPATETAKPVSQWRSKPPADCPFKPSASLVSIEFTGRHSDYHWLVHNGIWYYGTYCLGPQGSSKHNGFIWNGVKLNFNPPGGALWLVSPRSQIAQADSYRTGGSLII